ncbi:MAG TPA: hypothetical protein VJK07_03415 [Candidatus Nanoarchaeia archaeon]|nr:hypothetical protein [Candidatus Nanoarchaeia archaeon]
MGLKEIMMLVAILIALEGALALVSTKFVISVTKKLIKNKDLLRTFGFLEFLVGLALLFFALQS